jgi:hypothetical protein
MNASHPPGLATWLLKRFIGGNRRESLIGDLIEQYQSRRSRVWYWRQAVVAIVSTVAHDVSDQRALTARAAAIGIAVYLLMAIPLNLVSRWAANPLALPIVWTNNWLLAHDHDFLRVVLFRVLWFGLPGNLLVYLACAFTGMVVAWTHRLHQTAMVCVASLSVLLFESLHIAAGLALNNGRHLLTSQMLVIASTFMLGRPISILIGGLWASAVESDVTGRTA